MRPAGKEWRLRLRIRSDGNEQIKTVFSWTVGNFLLARYSASGTLEEQISTPFTAGQTSAANDLAFQADGKLLLIGFTRNPNASISGNVFAIARFAE